MAKFKQSPVALIVVGIVCFMIGGGVVLFSGGGIKHFRESRIPAGKLPKFEIYNNGNIIVEYLWQDQNKDMEQKTYADVVTLTDKTNGVICYKMNVSSNDFTCVKL